MSAGAELPVLKKSALFGRLALGRVAGVTVVTPTKRLSQALMLEFDASHAVAGGGSLEAGSRRERPPCRRRRGRQVPRRLEPRQPVAHPPRRREPGHRGFRTVAHSL